MQYGDGSHVPAGPVDIGDASGLQDRTPLACLALTADLLGQFHEILSRYGQGPVDQLFHLFDVDDFTHGAPHGPNFPASRHSQKCRVGEHYALLAIRGHDAVRETIDEHAHPRLLVGNVLHGPGIFDGLPNKDSQLFGRERLGDEIESPPFHGFDGVLNRSVPADYDDYGVGVQRLDVGQHIEPGKTGHHQVQENEVIVLALDHFQPNFSGFGDGHLIPLPGQDLPAAFAHALLIVDNQNGGGGEIDCGHLLDHASKPLPLGVMRSFVQAHVRPHPDKGEVPV